MTDYTLQKWKEQAEYDLKRMKGFKREARKCARAKGAPVSLRDFEFILCHGGRITEENIPYLDNCYIHRLEISVPKDKKVYRFKTMSADLENFEPPF